MRTLLAIACSLLVAAPLAWIGGESHYQSCVTAAEARTPITVEGSPGDQFASPAKGFSLSSFGTDARKSAVNGCSRLP